jgi:hypothetical protein
MIPVPGTGEDLDVVARAARYKAAPEERSCSRAEGCARSKG